ncbi:hydrogenase formation protein HypD [candidate division WOR-3 bacterium]|nr:hydrogenase formation protein HypD [candidate division WOR-3 bacterium]
MASLAEKMIQKLQQFDIGSINLMEVCGTHTMAIARSGLRDLLPDNLTLLSGPGCPVCVTPQETIDRAILLAQQKDVIITTFGDMVRVPGSSGTLEQHAPLIVYSALDALKVAQADPSKQVVFIGVGFETTSPTIAATVLAAKEKRIRNFSVLPSFRLIPPALRFIAGSPKINVDGLILPGHVSVIIGSRPYEFLAREFNIPGCITGFEPIDILHGILNIVQQIADKKACIAIEYSRVVGPEGNKNAQAIIDQVFTVCDAQWRGIGTIPGSGLTFNKKFNEYNALDRFQFKIPKSKVPRGCRCGEVLLGLIVPPECRLFGKACVPSSPIGPCMVSSEGSCAAYYKYGSRRDKKADRRHMRAKKGFK